MESNLAAVTPSLGATVQAVTAALGDRAKSIDLKLGEITVVVSARNYLEAARVLKEAPGCQFEQLIDLCGVDYSEYRMGEWDGLRYAVVVHLLSVSLNQRVRLRVFCPDDDLPAVESLTSVWSGANWFEREAFDLFGIVFEGHSDLRRLLTDYGFIGHPFRKDFPVSGHVEMRYDPEKKRVIYQPVSIEPREITPRIIREEKYGGLQ
ncbi:NADH-quinone oxidoreductase subunit C [Ramlibacter sp. PS3R-8]|uniref:NADH-quinone oxidoreductase subunit C n=1 Tax=Ramlibacter sp. PS3R-8 TaxID=3133437 RepID=UPI00309BB073